MGFGNLIARLVEKFCGRLLKGANHPVQISVNLEEPRGRWTMTGEPSLARELFVYLKDLRPLSTSIFILVS